MNDSHHMVVSQKNKITGILLIVIPILTILVIIIAFAVLNTLFEGFGGTVGGEGSLREVTRKIASFILGYIGLIAVFAAIVGIPIGIIFLTKKSPASQHYDERSGKGEDSEIPDEILGWNWGAFGLTWIWGLAHRVWISFLMFVPLVNFVFWFVLGAKGNEWAWRKNHWVSVDQFKKSQRKWKPWGIAFFILRLLPLVFGILITLWTASNTL